VKNQFLWHSGRPIDRLENRQLLGQLAPMAFTNESVARQIERTARLSQQKAQKTPSFGSFTAA
jgi:hypothetical protein